MGNNIKNCLECQKNQFWVEIRLVDELNKPFGSLTGTLKDATSKIPSFFWSQIIPSVLVYKRCCFR
jgi:hypothetical protein